MAVNNGRLATGPTWKNGETIKPPQAIDGYYIDILGLDRLTNG
jgi:hypothetical protein